jgi:aryl-alcohol dehydrogenase-like predicted oxidoreductase
VFRRDRLVVVVLATVASVITGATTAAQVQANVRAACWSPSAGDLAKLDVITTPGR